MALIDEFLYGLGFDADLRGGQAFDEQLKHIGDHGESTRHSLLSTITAANLLSSALEKGASLIRGMGAEFVHTAREMEDAKITFESMYTTAAEGEEKFKWLWAFAKSNPVMGFDAAKQTFMALKNNGIEPTTAALKAMGDTMAALPEAGKLLPQGLGELIEGRYHSGGVLSPILNLAGAGKNRVYEGSYVNKAGEKIPVKLDFNDAEKATDQFMQILRDRFDGTMEAHGKTFTGLISRVSSDWQSFENDIMNNGLFSTLEEQLFKLLADWELFSKSPDAKVTMQAISNILAGIVKIIGEALRLTGQVITWFDKWLGSANAIAFVLGSMFLISKWSSIVTMAMNFGRYLREVVTALELVAAGEETVTALGILMDAVLAPIALIPVALAAAALGLAALINQWGKFKDGMSTGFLKDFFTTFDNGITRMMAWLRYWLDYLDIGTLKMRDMLSKAHMSPALTDDEKKDLATKQAEHNDGVGAYVDREVAINTDKRNSRQRFADVAATMHRLHPGWGKQQIAEGIAQQDPQLWASRLAARDDDNSVHTVATGAGGGKTYQSGTALNTPAVAAPQSTDNSLHVHVDHVSVTADSPQDFAHQMQQGLAAANAGLASTMENQSRGGRKP